MQHSSSGDGSLTRDPLSNKYTIGSSPLAYHCCNQPPNAGVGTTNYEDPYYGKVTCKFERKKEAILKKAGLFGGQKAARLMAAPFEFKSETVEVVFIPIVVGNRHSNVRI